MDPSLSLIYLPIAVGLGALHALEPGHSKTLIAGYLIAAKGTRRDALLLGLSAAATHSIIVVALAVTALWLGNTVFTDRAVHWLQLGSAVAVILLGLWLCWRRWPRRTAAHVHHHHAPEPITIASPLAAGSVAISATPEGERLRYVLTGTPPAGLAAAVFIQRPGGVPEMLELHAVAGSPLEYRSAIAPAEPHEFTALLTLKTAGATEEHAFAMHEPAGHAGHDDPDEDAHACAHAAAMPESVRNGERPSAGQVIAFGAAGGLIPCPASITVMLLALSVGQMAFGILAVLCFSLGLAIALVGVGLLVVLGLSKLSGNGRFAALSRYAPLISSAMVMLSGVVALVLTH